MKEYALTASHFDGTGFTAYESRRLDYANELKSRKRRRKTINKDLTGRIPVIGLVLSVS